MKGLNVQHVQTSEFFVVFGLVVPGQSTFALQLYKKMLCLCVCAVFFRFVLADFFFR